MVNHNIGGGAGTLAEKFADYLPDVRIAHVDHPDRFHWSGMLVARNNRALWRIRANAEWNFRTKASIKNTVFVTLPKVGGLKVIDSHGERVAGPGQAIVLYTPEERDNVSLCAGEHARTSLKWSIEEASCAISSVFGSVPLENLPPMPVLNLGDDRGEVIRRLLSAIARDLSCPQSPSTLASELMSEAVLRMIFEPLLDRIGQVPRHAGPAPRAVKQAIEYMRANAGAPIRIRDIADACYVTPRTLENGFRDFKGTTPIAYLRQLRLEAVRRELKNSQSSARISEIARRWGFVDLGRFAERYRLAFGELPSETVRKR
ncbi:helix-turn-helix transcriptional regulator [Rhizomicrobium electricum]|uniref:HTH araC/xylS-type domain-containing protein n=1 Tax=Rhizomicrobium electricum TaxID=480070 RepID=A0ABP3NY02_9PROT|nr:helix-turn-helix transcriptional regulator [Rhizomicrobium electricum]NIJ47287.1 AraC-like DNA-binding protein [Rhizomicrobium electricum]